MKYFAYGSNMNLKRMEARGVRNSYGVKACLFGYKLKFNKNSTLMPGEGYANIVEEDKSIVEGILYEISQEGISNLDKYEKYPHEYDRILLNVRLINGIEHQAYVYIAQPDKTSDGLRPTRKYLNHLLCAKDLLSKDYLMKLSIQKTLE